MTSAPARWYYRLQVTPATLCDTHTPQEFYDMSVTTQQALITACGSKPSDFHADGVTGFSDGLMKLTERLAHPFQSVLGTDDKQTVPLDKDIPLLEKVLSVYAGSESFSPGYFLVRKEKLMPGDTEVAGMKLETYGYFDSYAAFKAWYDKLPEEHRMYHEYIFESVPTKAFFDIDAKQTDLGTLDRKDVILAICNAIVKVFRETFHYTLSPSNMVMCDSSNAKKLSRHIIIRGYHFEDMAQRTMYTKDVLEELAKTAPHLTKFLDVGASMRPGTLRMTYSHKRGEPTRVKKILAPKDATFEDTLVTRIPKESILLPHQHIEVSMPDVYIYRQGGFLYDKVCEAVQAAFPQCNYCSYPTREGNRFFFPATLANCPICNVHHSHYGLIAYIHKRDIYACCSRRKEHNDTAFKTETLRTQWDELEKLVEDGDPSMERSKHYLKLESDLRSYPAWMVDAIDYAETDGESVGGVKFDSGIDSKDVDHIQYKQLLDSTDTLIMQSGLGTGKTKAHLAYCAATKPTVSVIVTCSRALADSLSAKYGYDNYQDLAQGPIDLVLHPHLVIQVESLHRIRFGAWKVVWPDLLTLDESEGIINQFTHRTLLTGCGGAPGKMRECWTVFEALVRYSKKVVMLDAFLSDRSVSLIKGTLHAAPYVEENLLLDAPTPKPLSPPIRTNGLRADRPCKTVLNTYKSGKEKTYIFARADWMETKMDADIKAGKNIVLLSNSKEYTDKWMAHMKSKWPTVVTEYFCSDSDAEQRQKLKDVATHWATARVLVYTTTVTSGVSFELPHYNAIYAYFVLHSADYFNCMQMLGRVRNYYDSEVKGQVCIVSVSDTMQSGDEPETFEWLEKCLEDKYIRAMRYTGRVAEALEDVNIVCNSVLSRDGHLHVQADAYYDMQMHNAVHRIRSDNHLVRRLIDLMKMQGSTVVIAIEDALNSESKDLRGMERKLEKALLAEERATSIGRATAVNTEALSALRNAVSLSKEEIASKKKGVLAEVYGVKPEQVTKEFAATYMDKRVVGAYKRLVQSTSEETIVKSVHAMVASSAKRINDNVESGDTIRLLDVKDRTLLHKLTADLLLCAGYDLRVRRWEDVEPVQQPLFCKCLRERLPNYIYRYHTALTHEFQKKSAQLRGAATWTNKHLVEFVRGQVEATYGLSLKQKPASVTAPVGTVNTEVDVVDVMELSVDPLFKWDGKRYVPSMTVKQ